jgi:hypothetical protein
VEAASEPLRFTLSKGDSSLARGSSFDFEVTLSKAKPADKSVMLNFRPKDGGDWQQLPMSEIEKLNGFQGTLPDITEDLDFFVSCGADKSDTFHLSVYDPLVVQSLETTVHYPDYLKMPDELTRPSTGDVTTVVGSTVTLRVLTSTTLKAGEIKWNDGTTQPMTVDPQSPATATISFPVKADATYDYTVTDVNCQQAVSPASLAVHAVPDAPPTIAVKSPQSPVMSNAIGEVNFQVDAGDDFGVTGIDLVYSRVDAQGNAHETRLPLTSTPTLDTKDMSHAVEANYRLALEDMNPPLHANDAITYHLEARDAKGQKALSPVGFIIINYFEVWGTWGAEGSESGVHNETAADLMNLVAMIWDVNNAKDQTNPDDWKKQVDKVAGQMVDGQGQLLSFVNAEEHPQLAKVAPLIEAHVKKAHDALSAYDTATATTEISTAAAIFAGNGVLLNTQVKQDNSTESVVGSHFQAPAMTMLEQARLTALADATKDQSKQEGDSADAKAAEDAAKQVADLLQKQDALVAKAQAQSGSSASDAGSAKSTGGATGSANADAKQNPGSNASAPAKGNAADLAKQQHDLAEETRKAAAAAQAASKGSATVQSAADKAANAARLMEEASRAFAAGNAAGAQDKAQQAKGALEEAGKTLETMDRDKLEAAISAAQGHASVLLDQLKDLNGQTQAPDQRQQRDLQKQAYQQTQLGAAAEALNSEIASLNQWTQQIGQPEAMRALSEAQRAVRRGQPQAKLAGAAVDLNNGNPTSADGEQKSAIDSLQKIVDNLNAGSDALAASREAQLRRAGRVAQEAKKDLDAMQGKAPGTAAGKEGAGAQAEANGKAPGSQPGTQAGKGGQGATAQAGDANKGGAQPAQQPGEQAKADGSTPGSQAMSSGGGDPDQARRLAYTLTQLAAVIDNRQLVPQDQVDQLKEMAMDKEALEKKLETDPKFLADMAQVVSTINDKIEAELEAKTQAGKLYSSQREECPPAYRQFVNQYFEALSHTAPAANATPAPTPGAQP